jgi:hypothetical protein
MLLALEWLRVLRLIGVAAGQKDSENDDEGCHATAGNERGDEGTHTNFSLLDDLSLLHRLCRACVRQRMVTRLHVAVLWRASSS